MRIRVTDSNGQMYIFRPEDLTKVKGRKPKAVKFNQNPTQVRALLGVESEFVNAEEPRFVSGAIGAIFGSVARGECDSVSFAVYRDELQCTFWKKGKSGSTVLSSFPFTSVAAFIKAVEELS